MTTAVAEPSLSLDPSLFVTRSGGRDEQAQIRQWMEARAGGRSNKKVLLLLGPPGYGKSWALEQIARTERERNSRVFIVGPIILPSGETINFEWYKKKLLEPVEKRLGIEIGDNPQADLRNNVAHLANTCRERTGAHPILIVDELDHAPDKALAERQVLAPWMRAGGSVIVGLRFNRSFYTAELRSPDLYETLQLNSFEREDALAQFERLAARQSGKSQVNSDALVTLIDALPAEERYDLGIPAINRCLWEKHLPRLTTGAVGKLEVGVVHNCIEEWLLRKPLPPSAVLTQLLKRLFQAGSLADGPWSQSEWGDKLNMSPMETGELMSEWMDLNIVEALVVDGNNVYQIRPSWRTLLRMHHYLRGHA